MQELGLERPALRDVAHERDVAARQEVGAQRDLDAAARSVGAVELPFAVEVAVLGELRPDPLGIGRVLQRRKLVGAPADQLVPRLAEELGSRHVDLEKPQVVVEDQQTVLARVEDRMELTLPFPQRLLGTLRLGDVDVGAERAHDLTGGVAHRRDRHADVDRAAVLAAAARLVARDPVALLGSVAKHLVLVLELSGERRQAPAEHLLRKPAVRALGGLVPERHPVVDVHDHDRDRGSVHEGSVALLGLVAAGLDLPAVNRAAQDACRCAERLDLGAGPLAFGDAVVEAEEAPPAVAGEDRHERHRPDALDLELLAEAAVELVRAAVDDAA